MQGPTPSMVLAHDSGQDATETFEGDPCPEDLLGLEAEDFLPEPLDFALGWPRARPAASED